MKLNWFKKKEKQNKEATTTMSTLEEVKKAYADLSEDDKKSFHQSLKDRVDESVGEQEHLKGETDSQTAKDRVDEAEGEEKALEEKREERHEEHQDERDAGHEDRIEQLFQAIKAVSARLDALARDPQPASKETGDELDKLVQKYSN